MSTTYRKFLASTTTILMVIILLAFIYVLVSSISMDNTEISKHPNINVEELKMDETIEYQLENHLILITKNKNDYSVVSFPAKDGTVYMPEFNWSRPRLPCKNFIQPSAFQCLDKYEHRDELVWWHYMKWDKSGKYIGDNKQNESIPNLKTPKYEIIGNNIVILQL